MYIFEESDILSRFFVETFQIFPVCLIKWISYYAGCITNSEYFCVPNLQKIYNFNTYF